MDDDETLAEDEDGRVDDGAGPAVEDDEKGQLGEEGKGEEEEVDQQGDYRQGEDAPDKERIEVGTAEEVPYPVEGVGGGSEGAREVVGRSAKRLQHDLTRQGAHRLRVWHDGLLVLGGRRDGGCLSLAVCRRGVWRRGARSGRCLFQRRTGVVVTPSSRQGEPPWTPHRAMMSKLPPNHERGWRMRSALGPQPPEHLHWSCSEQ